MAGRSATAREDISTLRTIGEVADHLDLPQHVLRFWETRFKEIDPLKRAGGRRFYRPRDIELVEAIRHLLYREGYTIKGVQRILKEQGVDAVIADVRRRQSGEAAEAPAPAPPVPEPPPLEPVRREPTLGQASFDLPEPEAPKLFPEAPSVAPPVEPPRPEPVVEALSPIAAPQPPAPVIPPAPVAQPVIAHPPVIVTRRLDQEQAVLLREVLAELEECKRLLNLTRR